jgi:hypothetical protein
MLSDASDCSTQAGPPSSRRAGLAFLLLMGEQALFKMVTREDQWG